MYWLVLTVHLILEAFLLKKLPSLRNLKKLATVLIKLESGTLVTQALTMCQLVEGMPHSTVGMIQYKLHTKSPKMQDNICNLFIRIFSSQGMYNGWGSDQFTHILIQDNYTEVDLLDDVGNVLHPDFSENGTYFTLLFAEKAINII